MKSTKVYMEYHGKPCVIIFDKTTKEQPLHVAFDVLQYWHSKKYKSGHSFVHGKQRVTVWYQGDLVQKERQLSLFSLEVSP